MTTTQNKNHILRPKGIELQNILCLLPENVVNIIDNLSTEFEEMPLTIDLVKDVTDYEDERNEERQSEEFYEYKIYKYKKGYKIIHKKDIPEYEFDTEEILINNKEELTIYFEKINMSSPRLLNDIDILIARSGQHCVSKNGFRRVFNECKDLIGHIYKLTIPIEVNAKMKTFCIIISDDVDDIFIQKNDNNMYSLHQTFLGGGPPKSYLCIYSKKRLIKYIGCYIGKKGFLFEKKVRLWENISNILIDRMGKEEIVLNLTDV